MKKSKNEIDVMVKDLDQHDVFDYENIFKTSYKYSRPIGMFLIDFSRLEYFLNYMICKSINERGDEIGLRVIKYLEMDIKISLANDQYRRLVNLLVDHKVKKKIKIKFELIMSRLKAINKFRNYIAHASWITLDKNGFVRIDVRENKGDGTIYFKYAKLSPSVINRHTRELKALGMEIVSFVDKLDEALKKNS